MSDGRCRELMNVVGAVGALIPAAAPIAQGVYSRVVIKSAENIAPDDYKNDMKDKINEEARWGGGFALIYGFFWLMLSAHKLCSNPNPSRKEKASFAICSLIYAAAVALFFIKNDEQQGLAEELIASAGSMVAVMSGLVMFSGVFARRPGPRDSLLGSDQSPAYTGSSYERVNV